MKNIKNFDDFKKITEEISDEYLTKSIAGAREKGRVISPGYEQNLKKKKEELNKADDTRKQEEFTKNINKRLDYLKQITNDIYEMFDNKTYNIGKHTDLKFNYVYFTDGAGFEFSFSKDRVIFFKLIYKFNDDSLLFLGRNDSAGQFVDQSLSNLINLFPQLSKFYKTYFPQSKYADRRIWSSLD